LEEEEKGRKDMSPEEEEEAAEEDDEADEVGPPEGLLVEEEENQLDGFIEDKSELDEEVEGAEEAEEAEEAEDEGGDEDASGKDELYVDVAGTGEEDDEGFEGRRDGIAADTLKVGVDGLGAGAAPLGGEDERKARGPERSLAGRAVGTANGSA